MLKINIKYNKVFVADYTEYVMDEVIIPRMGKLSVDEKHSISAVFPDTEILRILQAEPETLEETIYSIFLSHPAIAERYCYSYIMRNVSLYEEPYHLKLKNEDDIAFFDDIVAQTLDALRGLPEANNLVLTRYYIDLLASGVARNKKRKILCRLINAKRNHSVTTDKIKSLFPAWINSLESIFDYQPVADKYGYEITQYLELEICPYCGIEKIQTMKDDNIESRPDLDHFYPKARFPFLAMSIYNLIPSGIICNQKHKKSHSMLGYLHPFSGGVDEGALFVFGYIPDSKIEHTLNVSLTRQTSDAKENNLKIFKIAPLYNNNNELKRWYAKVHSRKSFFKESGKSIKEYEALDLIVDLTLPATCEFAQKYKVDALNDMFGENLMITQQQHK